jgi:hypothetical protein
MTDDVMTNEGRARIWRYAIIPLLDEYFHNRRNRDELLAEYSLVRLLQAGESVGEGPAPVAPAGQT